MSAITPSAITQTKNPKAPEFKASAVLPLKADQYLQLVKRLQDADPYLTLLTGKELAIFLKVSLKKIEGDRCKGSGISFIRLSSGAIRYRLQTVLKFLEDNQRTNTCK